MFGERELIANYPCPIVAAYLPVQKAVMGRAASAHDKASQLCTFAEVIVKYTAALVIAQYCAYGLRTKEMESELRNLAREPNKMAFGSWIGILQHGVRAFKDSGFGDEAIVPYAYLEPTHTDELVELSETILTFVNQFREPLKKPKAYQVSLHQIMEGLVQFRNLLAHPPRPLTDDLAQLDFSKLLAGLRALLGEMDFLARYPLIYIEHVSIAGGKKIHDAQTVMGMAMLAREKLSLGYALEENSFYILRPTDDEPLLCLGPILKYENDAYLLAPDSAREQLRGINTPQRRALFSLASQESLDTYTQAVRNALKNGTLSTTDQQLLVNLARTLGIAPWLARQIEEEIRAETRMPSDVPTSQSGQPSAEWQLSLGKPIRKMGMSRLAERPNLWAITTGANASDDALYMIDAQHQPRLIRNIGSRAETIACSERGDRVAIGTWNGQILVFDEQGRPCRNPYNLGNVVKALALSADGSKLAATTWGEYAFLFDLERDATLAEVRLGDAGQSVAINPNAQLLAAGTYHGLVTQVQLDNSEQRVTEIGDPVTCLMIAEGNKVVAACADGRVSSLDSSGDRLYRVSGEISDLAVSRDGHKLVVAHSGRRLAFLNDAGGQLRPAHPHDLELDGSIVHIAISDDGKWCFVATSVGTLYIYEETHERERWSLGKSPADLVISADARHLVVAFTDGDIRFFTMPDDLVPNVEPELVVTAIATYPPKLISNQGGILEIQLHNKGEGVARDVSATVTARSVVVSGTPSLESLGPNDPDTLRFEITASKPGPFLLTFAITFRNDSGKPETKVIYTDDAGRERTGTRFDKQFEAV